MLTEVIIMNSLLLKSRIFLYLNLYFLLPYFCMCIVCVNVFMCVHTYRGTRAHGGQRSMPDVLLHRSPPYILVRLSH